MHVTFKWKQSTQLLRMNHPKYIIYITITNEIKQTLFQGSAAFSEERVRFTETSSSRVIEFLKMFTLK